VLFFMGMFTCQQHNGAKKRFLEKGRLSGLLSAGNSWESDVKGHGRHGIFAMGGDENRVGRGSTPINTDEAWGHCAGMGCRWSYSSAMLIWDSGAMDLTVHIPDSVAGRLNAPGT
jgi:hypothetical protein